MVSLLCPHKPRNGLCLGEIPSLILICVLNRGCLNHMQTFFSVVISLVISTLGKAVVSTLLPDTYHLGSSTNMYGPVCEGNFVQPQQST